MSERKKKVLLVDDAKFFLEMEKDFLKRKNIDVLTATSGHSALAIMKADKPDLVVLDLKMPDMSGLDVLKKMKEDEDLKNIPVLMLSSSANEEDVRACLEAGASAYLTKPVNHNELLSKMAELMKIPRRRAVRIPVHTVIESIIGRRTVEGEMRDISETGCFIVLPILVELGAIITLKFTLPEDDEELEVRGEIVRRTLEFSEGKLSSKGYGVEFTEIKENVREKIKNFVERRNEK